MKETKDLEVVFDDISQHDERICCHDDSVGYRCEYDAAFACKHPLSNGFVLTSTLNGSRPGNCPKLPGNAITEEEKAKREAEEKKRGESFRYGGFFHDYEKSCKQFGETECFHCHKQFEDTEKPYCRVFPAGVGMSRFALICRECAYSFGDGVIERDGKTYYGSDEYKGEI